MLYSLLQLRTARSWGQVVFVGLSGTGRTQIAAVANLPHTPVRCYCPFNEHGIEWGSDPRDLISSIRSNLWHCLLSTRTRLGTKFHEKYLFTGLLSVLLHIFVIHHSLEQQNRGSGWPWRLIYFWRKNCCGRYRSQMIVYVQRWWAS